jgi:hypothetical protein
VWAAWVGPWGGPTDQQDLATVTLVSRGVEHVPARYNPLGHYIPAHTFRHTTARSPCRSVSVVLADQYAYVAVLDEVVSRAPSILISRA